MFKPSFNTHQATQIAWARVERGIRCRDYRDVHDGRMMMQGISLTLPIDSDEEAYVEWLQDAAFELEIDLKYPNRRQAA